MCLSYPKEFVESILKCEKEDITSNIEGRYLLKVKLDNHYYDTLSVIMMNPSKADWDCSDVTVNKVISFVWINNNFEDSLIKNIGNIRPSNRRK